MLFFRIVLVYCLLTACSFAHFGNSKQKWLEFKKTYNKQYHNLEEENNRFITFLDNQKKINKHNQLYAVGEVTYTLKSNQFADLSHKEFLTKYVADRAYGKSDFENSIEKLRSLSLPSFVDWRQNGTVSEVQSQGTCRSSYAFATTGVLEGQYQRKTGNLIKFSEQYLLDCSAGMYNNSGCVGGTVRGALKFVSSNSGIDDEQDYPYQGLNEKCQKNALRTNFSIKSVSQIPSGQEWFLQTAIATIGPVSVFFDASLESFQFYSSGIYYDFPCSKTNGNHFGLAVGYGTEKRLGYYIVKNSFGKSWGEGGYIRMARFRANHCGIATDAIYPSL